MDHHNHQLSENPFVRLVTETPVSNVRNFSILAHVDHGKSTIADHLLTTNGLLSNALAGQVRYLDSRPDEQERLITMKASSVALLHRLQEKTVDAVDSLLAASAADFEAQKAKERAERQEQRAARRNNNKKKNNNDNNDDEDQDGGDAEEEEEEEDEQDDSLPTKLANVKAGTFVANLLDCPGHIDFSSEVATAVRMSDGAVIVVDLVDGVTMVTRTMLRQCYMEGLPMVLVLNKLDAIILTMQLTPEEGFSRLTAAVAECNAFLASCVAAEEIARAAGDQQEDYYDVEEGEEGQRLATTATSPLDDENDDDDDVDENFEQYQQRQRREELQQAELQEEDDDDGDEDDDQKQRTKHRRNKNNNNNNNNNSNKRDSRNKKNRDSSAALRVPPDELWFSPTKANVIFASGLHGFGFSLRDFAALYKEKIPFLTATELARGMWGQHFVDPKTKTIVDRPKKEGTAPLGVQLFCEPLWALHLAFFGGGGNTSSSGGGGDEKEGACELDQEKITDMMKKIGAGAPKPSFFHTPPQARQAAINRYGRDGVHLPKLFSFLGEWMPLNLALLDCVCCCLPSPQESQSRRAALLLPSAAALATHQLQLGGGGVGGRGGGSSSNHINIHPEDDVSVKQATAKIRLATEVLSACDRSPSAPLYAYVAKLFDVQYLAGVLPDDATGGGLSTAAAADIEAREQLLFNLDNHFVALTRVFSGCIRRGDTVCVESTGRGAVKSTVTDVYILRGQGLESVASVGAGTICALRGVSNSIVKCGTLSNVVVAATTLASRSASTGNLDEMSSGAGAVVGSSSASSDQQQQLLLQQQQLDDARSSVSSSNVASAASAGNAATTVRSRLPFLVPIRLLSSSVVQLAVTPVRPEDLGTLTRGLQLLYQTDPQVEIAVLPSGDHVVRCAGEVHAERCIEDLRTTFARVDLKVSDPIVGLRETVDGVYKINVESSPTGPAAAATGSVTSSSNKAASSAGVGKDHNAAAAAASASSLLNRDKAPVHNVITVPLSQHISVQLAVLSLPPDVVELLLTNAAEDSGSAPETARRVISMLRNPALVEQRRRAAWKKYFRPLPVASTSSTLTREQQRRAKIVAWGPSKMNFCGNVLLDLTGLFPALDESALSSVRPPSVIQEAIIGGFELGVSRGPMADEPMFGVAIVIVDFRVNAAANVAEAVAQHLAAQNVQLDPAQFAAYVRQVEDNEIKNFLEGSTHASAGCASAQAGGGVLTGQIVSAVATACRSVFSACTSNRRIVEPVYECIVYSAGQTRGKIYTQLHRRRAQIIDEVLQEGSDMFSIRCRIPATESFGLQDELRTATSGAATAQLRMERWDILDDDPYFKPRTREEIEELGETLDKPSLAMTIIEQVRKRKGLFRQQVVKHAEKQKFSIRGA